MTLGASARWPDTLYATVEPDAPIRALQADLAAAFPELPLYGDPGLRFEPHVTIAEGTGSETWAIADDPAWAELPVTLPVDEVALIVRRDGKWAVERAFPLRRRSVA
jgi:2'-5' RNA ligase